MLFKKNNNNNAITISHASQQTIVYYQKHENAAKIMKKTKFHLFQMKFGFFSV